MLQEFIETLARQAVDASIPQLIEKDPTKTYAVRKADGTVDFIGTRVPWRRHQARDLETIVSFAERFQGDGDAGDRIGSVRSAIWYSREKIVLLTNDAQRFDTVSVEMIRSQQIRMLADLDSKRPKITQRDFIFMLRTVFTPEAFPTEPKLIDNLRQVKFEANASQEQTIQRGKSSIGRAATTEVSFLDAIPDTVAVSAPLFDNSFLRKPYEVKCALEIYEDEMRLQMFPLPGEIEKAFARAEAELCGNIRDLLANDAVPIYYGQP